MTGGIELLRDAPGYFEGTLAAVISLRELDR